jgi:hypothetical protein
VTRGRGEARLECALVNQKKFYLNSMDIIVFFVALRSRTTGFSFILYNNKILHCGVDVCIMCDLVPLE